MHKHVQPGACVAPCRPVCISGGCREGVLDAHSPHESDLSAQPMFNVNPLLWATHAICIGAH